MVVGVRLTALREMVVSVTARVVLGAMHKVFTATRYLTAYFLKTSRELHDVCKQLPALDFLIGKTSQATVSVQYLSFLMSGDAEDELKMFWEPAGCASLVQFVEQKDELASIVRVAAYSATGGIHASYIATRSKGLNRVLQLADERTPAVDLRGIAAELHSEFVQLRFCCTSVFVFSLLADAGIRGVTDMFAAPFQRTLTTIAFCVSFVTSVADCERRHKRTKEILHGTSMRMDHYAAQSLCADVKSQSVALAKRSAQMAQKSALPIMPPVCDATAKETRAIKTVSAYDLFKVDSIKEAKLQGGSAAKDMCFSAAGRQRLDKSFSDLTPNLRATYEHEASTANESRRRVALAIADKVDVPILGYSALEDQAPSTTVALQSVGLVALPADRVRGNLSISTPDADLHMVCHRCGSSELDKFRHATVPPPLIGTDPLHVVPWDSPTETGRYVADLVDDKRAALAPIHPTRYDNYTIQNQIKKCSTVSVFRTAMQHKATDTEQVPKYKVAQHEHLCFGICRTIGAAPLLSFQQRVVGMLSGIVGSLKRLFDIPTVRLPRKEVIFEFDVFAEPLGPSEWHMVCQLTNCKEQSGPDPASQVFLRFNSSTPPPILEGCLLVPKRLAFAESVRTSAHAGAILDPRGYGQLHSCTHKELFSLRVSRRCHTRAQRPGPKT